MGKQGRRSKRDGECSPKMKGRPNKAYQFTSSTPCGYIQKKHWIENVMGVHSKTIGCYIHLWLVGFQIALILYRQVAKETLQKGSA